MFSGRRRRWAGRFASSDVSRRRCHRVGDSSGCGLVRDSPQSINQSNSIYNAPYVASYSWAQSMTSASRAARLFRCLRTFRCRRVEDACCYGRVWDGPQSMTSRAGRLVFSNVFSLCCRRIRDAAVVGSSWTAYSGRLLRAVRHVFHVALESLL